MDNINLDLFRPEYDLETINKWLFKRDHPVQKDSDLPSLGYIAFNSGLPIAAGFLRMCEGNYAVMDSLVTNPEAVGSIRSACIDKIVEKLIGDAKHKGIKQIIAFSVDANTLMRSEKHGFKKLPHTAIALKLGE